MDGLLINSEHLSAQGWIDAGNNQGYAIPKEFCAELLGLKAADCDRKISTCFPGIDGHRLRQDWQARNVAGLERGELVVLPGVHRLLDHLVASDIPHILATSSHRDFAEAKLNRVGLSHLLANAITGDQVRCGKPAPDAFLAAAHELGVNPSACVAFEDSEAGVIGATQACMTVVMVPSLRSPPAAFHERPDIFILSRIDYALDLPFFLKGQNKWN